MSSARRWAVWGGEEVFDLRASMMEVRRNCSGGGKVLDGGVMPCVAVGSVGVVVGDSRIGRLVRRRVGGVCDGMLFGEEFGDELCLSRGVPFRVGGELSSIDGGGSGRGILGIGNSL